MLGPLRGCYAGLARTEIVNKGQGKNTGETYLAQLPKWHVWADAGLWHAR